MSRPPSQFQPKPGPATAQSLALLDEDLPSGLVLVLTSVLRRLDELERAIESLSRQ
jgi:hypothetical protein